MQRLTAPLAPKRGDVVAIVSPCSSVGFWVEHRAENGIRYLQAMGFSVEVMPHSGATHAGHPVSPQERADDIHRAFTDARVSVVLCSIGGDESIDVVPHLDFELIAAHPKVFQGYSDATVLHWAIAGRSGFSTFHGPALLPELGEHPRVLPYTDRYLRAAWFGDEALAFEPSDVWTDEFLDWVEGKDLERARMMTPSDGWVTIRPGVAEGSLVGGCLETILRHLVDSDLWLDLSGSVFFIETSEETPTPEEIGAYLRVLSQHRVFDQIAALIVGKPYGYRPSEVRQLWSIVEEATEMSGIPVLGAVELGHTDPMITVPFGVRARVDAGSKLLRTTAVPTS